MLDSRNYEIRESGALGAGIWGVLIITPLYFIFDAIGRKDPPPISHPGFYYGFVGAALAWQLAFFVIGRDPVRYRPLMIPSVLEKFSYAIALFPWRRKRGRIAPIWSSRVWMGCSEFYFWSSISKLPLRRQL